jgi:Flp pilus assembly protein TadG
MNGRLAPKLQEERGATLLMVALSIFALIAVAAFVLEMGNWYVHKRHLQLQADAGALAGAAGFNRCVTDASGANAMMLGYAKKYAGDPTPPTGYSPSHNVQVSNDTNIVVKVNSDVYGSSGVDNSQTDPAPGGAPCTAGYVDVKATENNLPWLSFFRGVVPSINAHARVSVFELSTLGGALPLAVEDVQPLAAAALFVRESDNVVLGRAQLLPGSLTTLNGQSLIPWSGISTAAVSVQTANTGVVIALCTNRRLCSNPASTTWMSGSLAAVCGQALVTCDAGTGARPGLEFIHGYSTSGTGSASNPIVRSVTLSSGTCTDDSAPYFLLNGGCTVGATVQIDFGVTGDPSRAISAGGLAAKVGIGNCNLAYVSSNGTTSTWTNSSCVNLASGAGQVVVNVDWQTGQGRTKVTGTFAQVARPFANDGVTATQSYPIEYAEVTTGAGCAGNGHSVAFGNYTICVGIGIKGSLENARDFNDPTRLLRFRAATASHTGAVDCGGATLRNMIANGCTTPVQRNDGDFCPNSVVPVNCLPILTGLKTGQENQGMDMRWANGGVCSPNNWVADPSDPTALPDIPNGDPRVVPLIITMYRAFSGSGGGYVPVIGFATFYVTGWSGSDPSCNGINEPAPPDAVGQQAVIWGHFVKYVGNLGSSTGTFGCSFDPAQLTPCITVMSR